MACWTLSALFIPILVFALGVATDFSPDPPRYWQRPRSYGQAIFLAAVLWSIGWFSPTLWVHRHALDRPDFSGVAILWSALVPDLPAGLGVFMAGLGVLLFTTAPTRRGSQPHCRHCGYRQAAPGYRLTPTCPECGRIWSWFGAAAIGEPYFRPLRAAFGLLLSLLGLTAIASQAFI